MTLSHPSRDINEVILSVAKTASKISKDYFQLSLVLSTFVLSVSWSTLLFFYFIEFPTIMALNFHSFAWDFLLRSKYILSFSCHQCLNFIAWRGFWFQSLFNGTRALLFRWRSSYSDVICLIFPAILSIFIVIMIVVFIASCKFYSYLPSMDLAVCTMLELNFMSQTSSSLSINF